MPSELPRIFNYHVGKNIAEFFFNYDIKYFRITKRQKNKNIRHFYL